MVVPYIFLTQKEKTYLKEFFEANYLHEVVGGIESMPIQFTPELVDALRDDEGYSLYIETNKQGQDKALIEKQLSYGATRTCEKD